MLHSIAWRVGTDAALDFWAGRLEGEGVAVTREANRLRFADPEGLGLELAHVDSGDPPLVAAAADIPAEHALQGFDGARAYTTAPERSAALLHETLQFEHEGDGDWICAGEERGARWSYDPPPPERGIQGAGTVHHIAWAAPDVDHEAWRKPSPPPARTSRRSSTASTSSRSTSASRPACCSRSPPSGPASPPTRTRRTWARPCACRPSTSTCARSSSAP